MTNRQPFKTKFQRFCEGINESSTRPSTSSLSLLSSTPLEGGLAIENSEESTMSSAVSTINNSNKGNDHTFMTPEAPPLRRSNRSRGLETQEELVESRGGTEQDDNDEDPSVIPATQYPGVQMEIENEDNNGDDEDEEMNIEEEGDEEEEEEEEEEADTYSQEMFGLTQQEPLIRLRPPEPVHNDGRQGVSEQGRQGNTESSNNNNDGNDNNHNSRGQIIDDEQEDEMDDPPQQHQKRHHLPLVDLCEQWNMIDSSCKLTRIIQEKLKHQQQQKEPVRYLLPEYLQDFLEGNLQYQTANMENIIDLFAKGKPENEYGFIIPALFLVEFCMIKRIQSLHKLLEFYQQIRTVFLYEEYSRLMTCIVLQQLQEQIKKLPSGLNIPNELKNNLNYRPIFEEIRDGESGKGELNSTDNALINQIKNVLIRIFMINNNRTIDDLDNNQARGSSLSVPGKFGVAVVVAIMNGYKLNTFRNVYETMMLLAVEMEVGCPQTCFVAVSPLGVHQQIKIHQFNAAKHGVPDNYNMVQPIPCVSVSASSIEIQVFLDLLYTGKSAKDYDGLMSYNLYLMVKALKIPDPIKFMFRHIASGKGTLFDYTVTGGSRIDILKIYVKERNEEIFGTLEDVSSWLMRHESKSGTLILSGLSAEDVIWLLDRPNIPFPNELEVYIALVNWAMRANGKPDLHSSRLNDAVKYPKVVASFQLVYQQCLCMLDLIDQFETIFLDGLIDHDVFRACYAVIKNPNMVTPYRCVRKRKP